MLRFLNIASFLAILLLLVHWIASYLPVPVLYRPRTTGGMGQVYLEDGTIWFVNVTAHDLVQPASWRLDAWPEDGEVYRYLGRLERRLLQRGGYSVVGIPIWLPMAVFLVYPVTSFVRRLDRGRRRRRKGSCVGCGYNLTGNVSGVCPECGSPIRTCAPAERSTIARRIRGRLFPELKRIDSESTRLLVWRAAHGSVVDRPAYILLLSVLMLGTVSAGGIFLGGMQISRTWGYIGVFVWGLIAPAVAMAAALWFVRWRITRALRRELRAHGFPTCVRCGYNLTGNVSGVCPECGKAV